MQLPTIVGRQTGGARDIRGGGGMRLGEAAASKTGLQDRGKLAETGEVRPGARSYERVRANDIERVNLGRKESGAGYGKQQGPTYDCNSVYAGLLVLSYKYYSLAHASHGNC